MHGNITPDIVVVAIYVERSGDEEEQILIVRGVDPGRDSRCELVGGKVCAGESGVAAAARHVAADTGLRIEEARFSFVKNTLRSEGATHTFRLDITKQEQATLPPVHGRNRVLVVSAKDAQNSSGQVFLPRRQRALMSL